MWPDNETALDLIGFKVHADLIREVVTDPTLLPVVLGVFGDWGGGKSSIMKMLANDLDASADQSIVSLTFNGWVFEGYEDAKTALLTSILVQLAEHKRLGPKLKDKLTALFNRVKWMEVAKLGIKYAGMPLAGHLLMSQISGSSTGALPPAALTLPDFSIINWGGLIKDKPEETQSEKAELLEVRKFRDEFEQMLADTDIRALIVLIDDLDRCLPERIIETLEAIKLFMAVPKTAFVIGADPRIVRHAIAKRYVEQQLRTEDATHQDQYDLINDYLEKLIQIPYHLPRLSPAEVETYINLLFCHKGLNQKLWELVQTDWLAKRTNNYYVAYRYTAISDAVGLGKITPELQQRLAWSSVIAPVITEGLKGNPRQIKRMLNAMLLREKLAKVAGIQIREEVLAKLMVLEYTNLQRFRELNDWQVAESGYPAKLKELEQAAPILDKWNALSGDDLKPWHSPSLQKWLQMEPGLCEVDLRDYFWLARDRTSATLYGVQMVSPLVRRLCESLLSENEGEQNMAVNESPKLTENERDDLFHLLLQEVQRHPEQEIGFEALRLLAESGLMGAPQVLLDAAARAPTTELPPSVPFSIQRLIQLNPELLIEATKVLTKIADAKQTKSGKAAAKALEGLKNGNI